MIVGNPPYSAGQRSANDNAANLSYPTLDHKIGLSYAKTSKATRKGSLYDSYIRAIKWASERIGDRGVVAFVTNAGWVDGNSQDGMRKCLAKEYSKMWILNLRGNQRTSGERSRREGGKIFGSGSRAAIAISILLKNPDSDERGQIFYCDIGDYLSREDKLSKIRECGSMANTEWKSLEPDQYGDWINQRDPSFDGFPVMGEKKEPQGNEIFDLYSRGLATGRDAWCYNFNKKSLEGNVRRSIEFFNGEVDRYQKSSFEGNVNDFIDRDSTRFSWDENQLKWVTRGITIPFSTDRVYSCIYRPFAKCHAYFARSYNSRLYRLPLIFPESYSHNLVICVSGVGATKQSALMVNVLPDLEIVSKSQCFPLYQYVAPSKKIDYSDLSTEDVGPRRVSNIQEAALAYFRNCYPSLDIDAETLFYYVYGVLHSSDYRERYSTNLLKQLPRIPAVKKAEDFLRISETGRELGQLHVGYEQLKEHPLEIQYSSEIDPIELGDSLYRVTQMKFGRYSGGHQDRTTIVYNSNITLIGVPLAAYDYVINGKSAIEWVMERQCARTDRASEIQNDANDWAIETKKDASYPLKLLKKIVTLSLETNRLTRQLPRLTT